jgi:hypothetical protein
MAVYGYLTRNLWARGEITEPKLVLIVKPPSETDLTVEIVLTDGNAVVVSDPLTTTIPANTETKIIELGDFIDAQFTAKNLYSGFYFVRFRVIETDEYAYLPLLCTVGYVTPPPIDDQEAFQYFLVLDKVTGHFITLPRAVEYMPSDPRFVVFAYYKRDIYGRLVGLSEIGEKVFDTGYSDLAVLKLTFKFNSVEDLLYHLLAHSFGMPQSALRQVIEAITHGEIEEALKSTETILLYFVDGQGNRH